MQHKDFPLAVSRLAWSNKLPLILALFSLLLPRLAMAWDGAGHQVIAAEARRQLSPEFKAEAIEVLKAHPHYAKWQSAYLVTVVGSLASISAGEWLTAQGRWVQDREYGQQFRGRYARQRGADYQRRC